jgi:hypothetical protein
VDNEFQPLHVEHLGAEGNCAGLVDAHGAVPPHAAEQRVHAAHAGPGRWAVEEARRRSANRVTVAAVLAFERVDIAERIPRAFGGKSLASVDRPPRSCEDVFSRVRRCRRSGPCADWLAHARYGRRSCQQSWLFDLDGFVVHVRRSSAERDPVIRAVRDPLIRRCPALGSISSLT